MRDSLRAERQYGGFLTTLNLGFFPGTRLCAMRIPREALLVHQPLKGRPIAHDVALLESLNRRNFMGHLTAGVRYREQKATKVIGLSKRS